MNLLLHVLLCLVMTTSAPRPDFAFVHINVVPMDRERILFASTVLVAHGRILQIGPAENTPVPAGTPSFDGHNRYYLMPSLCDMHVHLYYDGDLLSYLANGVGCVRNMRGSPRHLQWRSRVASGELLGPRVFTAGPVLSGPKDSFEKIETAAQAVAAVQEQVRAGYDFIKVYDGLPNAAYKAVLKTAHRLGVKVAGHIPTEAGLQGALAGHQDCVEHAEQFCYHYFGHDYDLSRLPEVATMTRKSGMFVCPTLGIIDNYIQLVADKPGLLSRPEVRFAHPDVLAWWRSQHRDSSDENQLIFTFQRRLVRALWDAGVPLLSGTDTHAIGFVPGFSLHRELRYLQECGLTPYEVLETTTKNPGRYLGQSFGQVREGWDANLLVVEGNPLTDLECLKRRVGIMADGRWHLQTELNQRMEALANAYAARPSQPPAQ